MTPHQGCLGRARLGPSWRIREHNPGLPQDPPQGSAKQILAQQRKWPMVWALQSSCQLKPNHEAAFFLFAQHPPQSWKIAGKLQYFIFHPLLLSVSSLKPEHSKKGTSGWFLQGQAVDTGLLVPKQHGDHGMEVCLWAAEDCDSGGAASSPVLCRAGGWWVAEAHG